MGTLRIEVGDLHFSARWEPDAPRTIEAIRHLLPLESRLIHCRWTGEATWSPFGDYPPGTLSGSLAAAGKLEPRDIELKWSLGDSVLYDHSFQSAGAARILGERVTRADGDVRLGANRLTARGAYGRPADQLTLTLDAPRLEEFTPLTGSLRARGTLSFSRQLFLRLVLQYDDFDKQFNVEPLITYKLNPFTLFYVGSTQVFHEFEAPQDEMTPVERQYFLKFQYLFRL